MQVTRITANLSVPDIGEARDFYVRLRRPSSRLHQADQRQPYANGTAIFYLGPKMRRGPDQTCDPDEQRWISTRRRSRLASESSAPRFRQRIWCI
jgi:hypothetical protein